MRYQGLCIATPDCGSQCMLSVIFHLWASQPGEEVKLALTSGHGTTTLFARANGCYDDVKPRLAFVRRVSLGSR
jgi:hypothetical protein